MEYPVVRIQSSDLGYFDNVDDIVGRSIAAGDPLIALEYVQGIQRDWFIKGLAVAKLLYRMKQAWDLFRAAGVDDDFENVVETTTGYKPATVNKYVNMWESIFVNDDLPEEIKTKLAGKPIETLLLLTAAAREGSLEYEDWERVAQSSDAKEVRSIVRERRGDQTSSRSAKLPSLFYRDTGTRARGTLIISVDGEQKVIGFLQLDSGDKDVEEYINKMINVLHVNEVF
jgi:hypothetical protein